MITAILMAIIHGIAILMIRFSTIHGFTDLVFRFGLALEGTGRHIIMVIMVPGMTMVTGGHIPITIPIPVIITGAGTIVAADIITAEAYTITLITEPVLIAKAE